MRSKLSYSARFLLSVVSCVILVACNTDEQSLSATTFTPPNESTSTPDSTNTVTATEMGVPSDTPTSTNTPDITNASRRIKKSEYDDCQNNGVTEIIEVLVGYDGIAIANSKKSSQMELSRKELYMALAKLVPGAGGKLVQGDWTGSSDE